LIDIIVICRPTYRFVSWAYLAYVNLFLFWFLIPTILGSSLICLFRAAAFFSEISLFTAVKTFSFLLLVIYHLAFWDISSIPSTLCSRLCLPVYLVWMSLLSGLETVIIISSPLFGLFLGLASEIIVEACDGFDKIVHRLGKLLNSHNILNISLQSLIELCHLSTLVPGHSERVLRETCEVFENGALLFRRYKLELCRSYFVEVPIGFIKEDNVFFYVLQYLPDFWGTLDYRAHVQVMGHVGFESGVNVSP
jgi:hypothetical protein